jgi:hypothetical protein
MKKLILLFAGILFVLQTKAQSQYGTPLIEGTVTVTINRVFENYCNDNLSTKTEEQGSATTSLTGTCVSELVSNWMINTAHELRGEKVQMNNFTTTLKEGDLWNKDKDVPKFPVFVKQETKSYTSAPCSGKFNPCVDNYKAVLTGRGSYSGVLRHSDGAEAIFSCGIIGLEKSSRYLFLHVTVGLSGLSEKNNLPGETNSLICEDDKEVWKKGAGKSSFYIVNEDFASCAFTVSDDISYNWFGSDGVYKQYKIDEDGNFSKKEMQLMRIDTAVFFKYMREKPSVQTFSATGSYYEEYGNDKTGHLTKRSANISVTLTLGKIADFTIEAENEKEYKDWLPGNPDYPESYKTLSVKAKFSVKGKQQAEKINFMITESSHLPGICTNYPPETDKLDIVFAPQDEQTDPNIKIVNDSIAITEKPVDEAIIVISSKDFGAYCKVRAMTESGDKLAICKDNDKNYLSIPYDLNDNKIADKWEKDMGVEGIDKLEDNDNLPTGRGSIGDGLTAFEEYRGFICEDDVIASCDQDHTKRIKKHVRTSPLCRDVFICDADGLFAKYMASDNPVECHWHYVNREQISLPPMGEVSQVIQANETDCADPSMNPSIAILNNWAKKEYRRVNANTPKSLRNTKQFGMYLLLSPLASTNDGFSVTTDNPVKASPLETTHLTVIPQYESMKARQSSAIKKMIKYSVHQAIKDKYTPGVVDQVVQIAYEAMIPHEIGHGLGIEHHTMGTIQVISTKTKENYIFNNINIADTVGLGQCNEICFLDGQEYLITGVQEAIQAMGVTECCMRYTVERETDFLEWKVLKPSMKFCRKGQTFVDATGLTMKADACFSKIIIRCNSDD